MIKFWCDKCLQEALGKAPCNCETTYHRERLSPEDSVFNGSFNSSAYGKAMLKNDKEILKEINRICDSPNTANK